MKHNNGRYQWRTGTPKEPGWYRASRYKRGDSWRWWNGDVWSVATSRTATTDQAASTAEYAAPDQNNIFWAP